MKLVLTLAAMSLCAGLAMSAMADTTSTTDTTTGTTVGATGTTVGTSTDTMGGTSTGTTVGTSTGTTGEPSTTTTTATTKTGGELTKTECEKITSCENGIIAGKNCPKGVTAADKLACKNMMDKNKVDTSTSSSGSY